MSVRYEKRVQDLESMVTALRRRLKVLEEISDEHGAEWEEFKKRNNCCLGQHAEGCANYTGLSRAELDNLQNENETLKVEVARLRAAPAAADRETSRLWAECSGATKQGTVPYDESIGCKLCKSCNAVLALNLMECSKCGADQSSDNCEVCKGAKGNVKGNENLIWVGDRHVVMCDDCHVEHMKKEASAGVIQK